MLKVETFERFYFATARKDNAEKMLGEWEERTQHVPRCEREKVEKEWEKNHHI